MILSKITATLSSQAYIIEVREFSAEENEFGIEYMHNRSIRTISKKLLTDTPTPVSVMDEYGNIKISANIYSLDVDFKNRLSDLKNNIFTKKEKVFNQLTGVRCKKPIIRYTKIMSRIAR